MVVIGLIVWVWSWTATTVVSCAVWFMIYLVVRMKW